MNKKRVKVEVKLLYKIISLINPRPNRLTIRIKIIEGLNKAFNDLIN